MYRYFSYSKILRNSRPPFYYKKKIEKYFLKQKKEVQEKKTPGRHIPPNGKSIYSPTKFPKSYATATYPH